MNCWFVLPYATHKERNDRKDNNWLFKSVQTPNSRILCSFTSLKMSLDANILIFFRPRLFIVFGLYSWLMRVNLIPASLSS